MNASQMERLMRKGAVRLPEPPAPPPPDTSCADAMGKCAAAMEKCAEASQRQAQVTQEEMAGISKRLAAKGSYKFTVKRNEAGLIESVIASPITMLGE